MKKVHDFYKQGFTLIELIVVIAILAFVTVVGIHSYGNIREVQAKKMNLANIKRVYHALATYQELNREMGRTEYFKGFDSLIDVSSSGTWYGTPGEIDFGDYQITSSKGSQTISCDARQVKNGLGIYDGSWKVLGATYDATGSGNGAIAGLEVAQQENKGMRFTGLYKSLGIYYLSEEDVKLLRGAGISTVFFHNPSTAQAHGASRGGYCSAVTTENGVSLSADKLKIKGGGPGFRPDMSAFYQTYVTNGLPVAMIIPSSSIYDDLGYDLALTNGVPSESYAKDAVSKVKLVCFGIGQNAECVINQMGLGEAPHNPVYDRTNYRNYIAVFAIKKGGQGVTSTCRLAGIIDCAGKTYKSAEYDVNWTTQLDN